MFWPRTYKYKNTISIKITWFHIQFKPFTVELKDVLHSQKHSTDFIQLMFTEGWTLSFKTDYIHQFNSFLFNSIYFLVMVKPFLFSCYILRFFLLKFSVFLVCV